MQKLIYSLLAVLLPILSFAAIPRPMLENVEALATMKYPIELCMASKEYEGWTIQKQTRFIVLGAKIDTLVLKIQKYYGEKNVFEAYLFGVSRYASSEQTKKTLLNKYGSYCADKIYNEINEMFTDSESQLNKFIK